MSDVVGVMYAGKLVEIGKGHEFRQRPLHPYAQALTATAFTTRGNAVLLAGEPASPVSPPTGCRFHPRCPLYERLGKPSICEESEPALVAEGRSHDVACHFASSDT
jgi:oligopeptide/dipeptide ABC transporter ATP-binding protein